MRTGMTLVLGGTGAIGSAVLRELARRDVEATFTFNKSSERADMLAAEYGHVPVRVDLADVAGFAGELERLEGRFDRLISCAAISQPLALADMSIETLRRTIAVNGESVAVAAKWFAGQADDGGDIVLVGALDRAQSVPLPVHFAASQGMLSAMAMALGHELGPRGIRVNLVTLGVMNGGLSADLATESLRDYERFSALRRVGEPDEAAKAITWLALENNYIQGKTIAVNGGI